MAACTGTTTSLFVCTGLTGVHPFCLSIGLAVCKLHSCTASLSVFRTYGCINSLSVCGIPDVPPIILSVSLTGVPPVPSVCIGLTDVPPVCLSVSLTDVPQGRLSVSMSFYRGNTAYN